VRCRAHSATTPNAHEATHGWIGYIRAPPPLPPVQKRMGTDPVVSTPATAVDYELAAGA